MTAARHDDLTWLDFERAKASGVTWEVMQPPRTIPVPFQPPQAAPQLSPPARPQIRAVVRTLLGLGLPLNRGLLFSPVVMVIPENAVVTIEDQCQHRVSWAPWCLVSYQGKLGYVNGIYLTILTERPAPQPQAKRARTSTSLNLRTGPDPRSDIVREMPLNSVVILGECRRIDDGATWCQVSHEGILGWANASYLSVAE